MVTVAALPQSRPLTYADLATMPDDGNRYELLDGVLLVSPAPRLIHQLVLAELHVLVRAAAPAGTKVLFAPVDVFLADDTVLQPDLLVVRREDLTDKNVLGTPLLAVEVLSPSTRRIDLGAKRVRFEAAGTAAYWVVDPDVPSLTAWALRGDRYELSAEATGDEVFETTVPFPITVVPARLLGSD